MARKARQRISYVLPLANSNGHRLGVNSLAVDPAGTLYSAGRDGLICSWELGINLQHSDDSTNAKSTFKSQVQAHTHWVNDIILANQNEYVVSCSSDLTVKLWRPQSAIGESPQTIGHHSDYVKCLVAPRDGAEGWVASGGLDRKIRLWDLGEKGEILDIDVKDEGTNPKGSVYALAHGGGILASGGPESVVRIWDPKSGKAITKFVGHTDNIRAILVSEQGDHILTASSDTTIKLWSLTGGRCLHTLSMHNDSVWSLFSSHPRLEIFHSSDRAGLVAKTDVRNVKEIDEGLCVAVCQEKDGVRKVVSSGDYIWTTTSSSNIKRWIDVDTDGEIGKAPTGRPHAASNASVRSRIPTSPIGSPGKPSARKHTIPISSLLRLSTTSPLPTNVRDPDTVTVYSVRQASISGVMMDPDPGIAIPMNESPDDTIQGQDGLIKHFLLNDRRRVLTLDTAGNVVLWDLIRCTPIKQFGKRDLEVVAAEVNTVETVANWCQVDTRTGQLAVVLEENYCFDAEMYADEIDPGSGIDYRDDQRVNLGKWVLRYLFANLIDEEIRRDEAYRENLMEERAQKQAARRENAPPGLSIPATTFTPSEQTPGATTPRVLGFPQTPNLAIGLATPGLNPNSALTAPTEPLPTANTEEDTTPIRTSLQATSTTGDYFSNAPPTTPGTESVPTSPTVDPQSEGGTSNLFSKFRSFGSKKVKPDANATNTSKPSTAVSSTDEPKPSSETEAVMPEPTFDDTLGGVIKKLRSEYPTSGNEPIQTKITPSLPSETPLLTLPRNTAIIIQEDKPDSGGVADLYRGTVGGVGEDADVNLLEEKAPAWLGDVLLLNKIPLKETVKISFVLQPWNKLLPPINLAIDTRLNANRMLRSRRIMAYVVERLPPELIPFAENTTIAPVPATATTTSAKEDEATTPKASEEAASAPAVAKPEDWLELLCHEQPIPINMTLATLKSHVWKNAGDVLIYYRRKDWKEIAEKEKEKESGAAGGDTINKDNGDTGATQATDVA